MIFSDVLLECKVSKLSEYLRAIEDLERRCAAFFDHPFVVLAIFHIMLYLIKSGRFALCVKLLKSGGIQVNRIAEFNGDRDFMFYDGQCLLHAAIHKFNLSLFEALIEAGANTNMVTPRYISPLEFLFECRDRSALESLLKRGANPNTFTREGEVFWHSYYPSISNKAMKLLLQYGLNINLLGVNGSILHYWLIYPGDCDRMAILSRALKEGADLGVINRAGDSPVKLAISHRISEVYALLIDKVGLGHRELNGDTILHMAVEAEDSSLVKALIQLGIDVNAVNELGNAALHIASKWLHIEIANLLIGAGADCNLQNRKGQTPFHLAFTKPLNTSSENKFRYASQLISAGARVDIIDHQGKTALNYMTEPSLIHAIKYLAQKALSNNGFERRKQALLLWTAYNSDVKTSAVYGKEKGCGCIIQ